MVARLTPDQKAACSSHVGVIVSFFFFSKLEITSEVFMLLPDENADQYQYLSIYTSTIPLTQHQP